MADILSQDELDALLAQMKDGDDEDSDADGADGQVDDPSSLEEALASDADGDEQPPHLVVIPLRGHH